MGSIPVLAVPVLNRGDLLLRLIRSIDYPVGRLVIVNNGRDPSVLSALLEIAKEDRFDLHIHTPERNLGVAGSWNWVMQSFPGVEYWLHVGSDMQLHPGDLQLIDEGMRRHPEMGVRTCTKGYDLFAIRPATVQTVGFFDENFYPAYFEDGDYRHRLWLARVPRASIGEASDETQHCQSVHGEPPSWGSHTIHSDARLKGANDHTFVNNRGYYKRKWGGGPREELFSAPFDDPTLPISYWVRDAAHVEENRAAFDTAIPDRYALET